MNFQFERYRLGGQRFVAGWLEAGAITMIKVLDSAQRSYGVSGAIAEIGVHHGKFFIALNLLQRTTECALAIDVFDDQELNIDNSGMGDRAKFERNVARWSSDERVIIHQGDSSKLNATTVCALAKSRIRPFSVDGGHTDTIVVHDMKVAERALCPGGIVIADDMFNQWWPGVATGTFRYMENGALQPFALGFNKVFFAMPEDAIVYRGYIKRFFEDRYPLISKCSELAGHEVVAVDRVFPRLRPLMARNKAVKSLYRYTKSWLDPQDPQQPDGFY